VDASEDEVTLELQHELCASHAAAMVVLPLGFEDEFQLTNTAPCLIPPGKTADSKDLFTVKDLLVAAGTSMHAMMKEGTRVGTARDLGFEIYFKIEYKNTKPMQGQTPIRYRYRPTLRTRAKPMNSVIWTNYPVKRTVIERRGVHFTPKQIGLLGGFSFEALMVAITTSLTFLVVANISSKTLAEYCLLNSKYYKRLINEYSPDFSDLKERKLDRHTLTQLQRECAENHLDVSGDKWELILKLNKHYDSHDLKGKPVELTREQHSAL
jgi:hypothetical protein